MKQNLLNIFNYTSYRKWLEDYCEAQKNESSSFSFRAFAKTAGFASPNYLQMVIQGKRNLSDDSITSIVNALGFGKKGAYYFKLLVHFAQASDIADKNRLFTEIIRFKNRSVTTKIISDQFDYYNEWYHCVIRELVVGLKLDTIDYTLMAKSVYPAILPKQAKKSVELLLGLELLYVNNQGLLEQASPLIATDRETQSVAIRNFHAKMLNIAREALANVPPEDREISSLTIRVSRAGFDKIKKRIQNFKEELMQIVREDQNVDSVYHADFLLFPVSKCKKGN
jgi:uncharacterized protein (TIGR02147 family)